MYVHTAAACHPRIDEPLAQAKGRWSAMQVLATLLLLLSILALARILYELIEMADDMRRVR